MVSRGDWEKALRKRFGPTTRLPGKISVSGETKSVRVVLPEHATTANMQSDNAAFEAWCLALRAAGAQSITLSWTDELGTDGHSNRFRFRVHRFKKLFDGWFHVDRARASEVSRDPLPPRKWPEQKARFLLNVSSTSRAPESQRGRFALDASEHDLELAIVAEPLATRLKQRYRLTYLARQLPVGTFDGVVSDRKDARLFTGGKSAIDLWGLAEDGRLVLFELKNEKNRKAGALSELLFYALLMRELQHANVRFDERPDLPNSYQAIAGTSGVHAAVLAPAPHPILTGGDHAVLRELNAAFAASAEPIRFGVCTFDADGEFSPLPV